MSGVTIFIVPGLFLIYSFILAYLVIFKGRFDLFYSIDQVKMLHKTPRERLKIAICIACTYIITAVGLIGVLLYL